ncbi:Uncharacterized conserved protein, DUF1015 family [Streptomyces zhaozhouensis]|uniref:Uncharacterized conserved protein, DUF1015 family n=1 Tax=Streptomyces zhaozhouensis TaxID=1300267 RepID=A0A286DT39_9ACTN|nr:DUF1015 domain-containing protein [Streptomyces zhaozhouensis]SOD61829.1 Uncharacterized conserved protein, DUF1015 family [Streptomyces zhaozhouensis]
MHVAGLTLAPFHAVRYQPQRVRDLAAVTSPPYDVVVQPDGRKRLETAEPHNVVRLILPEGADHAAAAARLRHWRANGVLTADPRPGLYVYEQRTDAAGVLQRGLLGTLALSPPAAGVVLPHEGVMADVVEERASLMRATHANLEPLLLSYRGDPAGPAARAVERAAGGRPLLDTVTPNGVRHRVWPVHDREEQAAINAELTHHRALIADGHHRWATALRLHEEHGGRAPWDRTLVLLVDTARHPLRVRAIHRVLPWLTPDAALRRLDGAFRATRVPGPLEHALARLEAAGGPALLLADGDAFQLLDRPRPELLARTVPRDRPARWRELDATVLHSALVDHLWRPGRQPGDGGRVRYLHDAPSALAQARQLGGSAVLLRPVSEATVFALAEAGVVMPQKSTSFGPKPASGLVLRDLADEAPDRIADES